MKPIYAGATLGVLGGGQLGRMFAVEALRMGYFVWVLDPDPQSPAGAVATKHICSALDDTDALAQMGAGCAAITTEFENIPAASMRSLAKVTRVAPTADAIQIAQDRRLEKQFVRDHGLETTEFGVIESEKDIDPAIDLTGFPAILKTAQLGYDGKGQFVCQNAADVQQGFLNTGSVPCVLEKRVNLVRELSVVLARNDSGSVTCFPVAENQHANGILDVTLVPARITDAQNDQAIAIATKVANALNYIGVMAVELFVDQEGRILINEMAPRPHNSGHFTQDATVTSQFEQQVRMLCGLPAGSSSLIRPVAMLNLLGERWSPTPDWQAVYANPDSRLHLYGKLEARHGRKMGHVNLLANTLDDAERAAVALKKSL